jgi:hypothetical protein
LVNVIRIWSAATAGIDLNRVPAITTASDS